MAKCEVTETQEYLLRMSEEEATALRMVCRCIGGDDEKSASRFFGDIGVALLNSGVPEPENHDYYHTRGSITFPNPLPAPEPPPLTLADIKPGEWFTHNGRCYPCLMAEGRNYLFLGDTVNVNSVSPSNEDTTPAKRITIAEARELAAKHGYLFPFGE